MHQTRAFSIQPCPSDSDHEAWLAMAHWAKTHLDQGAQRVACFFSHFKPKPIHRIFNEILAPYRSAMYFSLPYWENAEVPLIAHAFSVLDSLSNTVWPLTRLKIVFYSPFLGHAAESFSSIRCFAELEHQGQRWVNLSQLTTFIASRLPERHRAMLATQAMQKNLAQSKTMKEWSEIYQTALSIWGWPGHRPLHAEESKAAHFFSDCLIKLYSLDATLTCDHQTAIGHLRQTVKSTPYPCDGEKKLYLLRQIDQENHKGTWDAVLIQGQDQLPSPDRPSFSADTPTFSPSPKTVRPVYDQVEPIETVQGLKGGLYLLKDQAACPFRAYAKHRLHLKETFQSTFGLNPRQKKTWLRTCLSQVWASIKTQAALITFLDDPNHLKQLAQWVNDAFGQAIGHDHTDLTDPTQTLWYRQETKRLLKSIKAWLKLEAQRAGFDVLPLAASDQQIQSIDGFEYRLQMDRLDRTEDGDLIWIDYTTETAKPWTVETCLDDPKLPLYALTPTPYGDPQGVGLARLKAPKPRFQGISARETGVPGFQLSQHWAADLTYFQETIRTCLRDFISGSVVASPRYGKKTCEHCQMKRLCRYSGSDSEGSTVT